MTTLVKIIVSTLLSMSLFSCNFDLNFNSGIPGNGNVTIEKRSINKDFTAIKASEGLQVYLTQNGNIGITVEADENLHDLIITEVIDGVLKIHCKQNIGRATSKKVKVNFANISSISSTSGSSVFVTNIVKTEELTIKTSSGSNMKIEVNTSHLNCKSTSGSNLKISGKTNNLIAEANSGSTIKGKHLIATSSQVKATSGADVSVNTSEELVAKATSGGSIKYYGNPEKVEKKNSVSGDIKKY
ncbi:head GIN domain-containing protein [Snuella sedimenti]|uniref:DUF2807 domain-containing protein n=1 Tax=Snuella sedimenti TaxID=2798802 RepID=A0A8J7LRV0_9FLAO|nr:head GIN domain-containing protein [Snuella sedimenti]MBJ6367650.1 DUF2807 domain-containing protein [Snuella sedimenti]